MSFLFSSGVRSTIPDSGDLQARYDARELSLSDGQTVPTFGDETGNGYDLSATGDPIYQSSSINSNPTVRTDGTDDHLNTAWTEISQPYHIFAVLKSVTTDTNEYYWDSATTGNSGALFIDSATEYNATAGDFLDSGTDVDTNPHIFSVLYDGANSTIRLDGTQVALGDAGTFGLNGFRIGSRGDDTNYSNTDYGEILAYPQDKSSVQSDVEQYLSDGWGITI